MSKWLRRANLEVGIIKTIVQIYAWAGWVPLALGAYAAIQFIASAPWLVQVAFWALMFFVLLAWIVSSWLYLNSASLGHFTPRKLWWYALPIRKVSWGF